MAGAACDMKSILSHHGAAAPAEATRIRMMRSGAGSAQPHWYWIPVRVLLVTFLLTLLSFAVSLLLGILGTVIAGRVGSVHPDMTVAYRHIALPTAAGIAVVILIAMTVLEIRNFRQAKALTGIARASR